MPEKITFFSLRAAISFEAPLVLTALGHCGAVPGMSLAPELQDCCNKGTATPLGVSGNLCARRNIFALYDVRMMELIMRLTDPPFSWLLELRSPAVAEIAVGFGWLQSCTGLLQGVPSSLAE